MSKKAKKGGPSSNFKLVAKIDSEAELVQELQLKKKYLEEKFCNNHQNYLKTNLLITIIKYYKSYIFYMTN